MIHLKDITFTLQVLSAAHKTKYHNRYQAMSIVATNEESDISNLLTVERIFQFKCVRHKSNK